ncbi:hypothetical protein V8F33_011809 [Rhypophila sp. PSN 637]
MRECVRLRAAGEPKDWVAITRSEVYFGNVLASTGAFIESLNWELEAQKTRRNIPDDHVNIKWSGVIHQNIGRCYMFLNDHNEAENRLILALKDFEGSQNWAMLAYTLFVKGTLYRRSEDHQAAEEAYCEAQKAWLQGGNLQTHHFNGACMYKLGCVADDVGESEKAM